MFSIFGKVPPTLGDISGGVMGLLILLAICVIVVPVVTILYFAWLGVRAWFRYVTRS